MGPRSLVRFETMLLAGLSSTAEAFREPEVAIRSANSLPQLPAVQSKHFYTTPDASINAFDNGSSPFEHLQAAEGTENFAYAEANRLGTQAAYINVPHIVQKHVAPLIMPSARAQAYGNEPFALPFPHVQKGDIAFYLRLEAGGMFELEPGAANMVNPLRFGSRTPLSLVCRDWADAVRRLRQRLSSSEKVWRHLQCGEGSQIFVNLPTLNYILHGIQHYRDTEPYWRDSFWRGFGLDRLDAQVLEDPEALCTHVVRWCMTPFGVVTSQVTQRSDQGLAMVIDGRVERMRNYWASFVETDGYADLVTMQNERVARRAGGVAHEALKKRMKTSASAPDKVAMPQAGSELILILEWIPLKSGSANLQEAGRRRRSREEADEDSEKDLDARTHVLPNESSLGGSSGNRGDEKGVRMVFPTPAPEHMKGGVWQLVPSFASASNESCWKRHGYWHIATVTGA